MKTIYILTTTNIYKHSNRKETFIKGAFSSTKELFKALNNENIKYDKKHILKCFSENNCSDSFNRKDNEYTTSYLWVEKVKVNDTVLI